MGYSPHAASNARRHQPQQPPMPQKRPVAKFSAGDLVEYTLYNDTTDVGLIQESFFDFKTSGYRYKISSSKRQWPEERIAKLTPQY